MEMYTGPFVNQMTRCFMRSRRSMNQGSQSGCLGQPRGGVGREVGDVEDGMGVDPSISVANSC